MTPTLVIACYMSSGTALAPLHCSPRNEYHCPLPPLRLSYPSTFRSYLLSVEGGEVKSSERRLRGQMMEQRRWGDVEEAIVAVARYPLSSLSFPSSC